jgi:hypothetical protein
MCIDVSKCYYYTKVLTLKEKFKKRVSCKTPPLSTYHQTGILGMEIVIIINETTTLFSIVTLSS